MDDAVLRIDAARSLTTSTSTQENAWLVLAARALAKQLNSISLGVNGETRQGALYRNLRPDDLASSYAVQNNGDGNVQAVVSVSGSPLTPEPAAESGFKIERSYHTLAGEAADPSKARQNQRFVVVLKMTEPQPQFARVSLIDYVPPVGREFLDYAFMNQVSPEGMWGSSSYGSAAKGERALAAQVRAIIAFVQETFEVLS